MRLNCVTITGADEGVRPSQLGELSQEFPYVEWAVVMCASYEGKRLCYPCEGWLNELAGEASKCGMPVAVHLCGNWARDPGRTGRFSFVADRPKVFRACRRVQFNFGRFRHPEQLVQAVKNHADWEYVLQVNGPADREVIAGIREVDVNAVPLFDRSRGRGIVPKSWPSPLDGVRCGYAGGLRPESLPEQLHALAAAVGDSLIWIDMQTGVRDEQDRFDMKRVRQCLQTARGYWQNAG